MNTRKKNARIAGLLYFLIAITGGFGIMYVPSNIIISGDAILTADNIISSNFIYRLSIFSSLISQVLSVFLVLTLSRLFKDVNQKKYKKPFKAYRINFSIRLSPNSLESCRK